MHHYDGSMDDKEVIVQIIRVRQVKERDGNLFSVERPPEKDSRPLFVSNQERRTTKDD